MKNSETETPKPWELAVGCGCLTILVGVGAIVVMVLFAAVTGGEDGSEPSASARVAAFERTVDLELRHQRNGGYCSECWVDQPISRLEYKNLLEYRVESQHWCERDGKPLPGLRAAKARVKAQNGFGAELWSTVTLVAVRPAADWKLVYLGEEDLEDDFCGEVAPALRAFYGLPDGEAEVGGPSGGVLGASAQ